MRCRRCEPLPEDVRRGAELLGRRHALAIVYATRSGASRFNEYRQVLGAVPPTTLSARLDELEEAGVLERRVVDARPPRTEYALTERGERLSALLDALAALGR
ncbi:MAG TPA: helix-turn-helix domain-containing protein [Gaiellaceae bacterium]|nr:helix-turn-helix domain-containing protein [Gaiellaceae bacterium]